jgi:hypothetical protein
LLTDCFQPAERVVRAGPAVHYHQEQPNAFEEVMQEDVVAPLVHEGTRELMHLAASEAYCF